MSFKVEAMIDNDILQVQHWFVVKLSTLFLYTSKIQLNARRIEDELQRNFINLPLGEIRLYRKVDAGRKYSDNYTAHQVTTRFFTSLILNYHYYSIIIIITTMTQNFRKWILFDSLQWRNFCFILYNLHHHFEDAMNHYHERYVEVLLFFVVQILETQAKMMST